jgi:hypothetical protein
VDHDVGLVAFDQRVHSRSVRNINLLEAIVVRILDTRQTQRVGGIGKPVYIDEPTLRMPGDKLVKKTGANEPGTSRDHVRHNLSPIRTR